MTRDGDFWSRRKAGVVQEAEREEHLSTEAANARDLAALEERSDEEILAELALPDPATMKRGDNFAGFMHHTVPERLRKVALRQLWRSDPVLANLDGLNNYDTDFTQSDIPGIVPKTSYVVGKGFASTVLKPVLDAATPPEPDPVSAAAPALLEEPVAETVLTEEAVQSMPDTNAVNVEDEADQSTTKPGRMRFAYAAQNSAMGAP